MKLLHTADWHLGDRLGRIDRTDDLRRAVERIADYCRQERVDVLLLAGDIFSEMARPDGLREAVRHLQTTFEGFLHGGGTILAVTGNHDNENFCRTLRHAMSLAAPTAGNFGAVAPSGRLFLADEPTLLRLHDRHTNTDVQFVLMPYPMPSRFLVNEPLQKYGSFEEKKRHLRDAFAGRLRDIRADSRFDPRLPTVLVAHVHVYGAQVSHLFRLSEDEDVVFSDDQLSTAYAYVALGHIHKPQALGGHAHVRYCGSVERLDLGELLDRKEVTLFDVGPSGLVGEPSSLPLDATPIYDVAIANPREELPTLRDRYPDHATALVNLHVNYTAGVDNLETVLRELDGIFPRWYGRDWTESRSVGPALTVGAPPAKSFEETVRDYLAGELTNYSDDDRAAILELAEELLHDD
jgi:DNA repair protein SbcD/Mre11